MATNLESTLTILAAEEALEDQVVAYNTDYAKNFDDNFRDG